MKDILINEEFLETIRTYDSFGTFESEETHNVVPPILRHENLLNLRSIDKIIIERYIEDNKSFMTKEEWLKLPKYLDFNIYSTAISPFPYIISGAYHSRINLYIKLNALLHPYEKLSLKGNSNLKNLSDLKPYFSEYAQGFFQGYNEFEDNFIKPLLINLGIPNKDGYATEVFKFLTKDLSKETITTSGRGFTTTLIGDGTFEINNGHQDGVYEGYLYRAWCIVFSQNELFAPLFQKHSYSANFKDESKAKAKLTIHQIALKCVYENITVTRENCNKLIKSFGLSSGEALYQKFKHYSSQSNRTGIDDNSTSKKVENKIRLHEIVIENLSNDHTEKAIRELKLIKERAKKYNY